MSRFAFLALIFAAPAWADVRYFSEIPDLPLPAGFTESQTAVGFDGADGRLIMAEAIGAGTAPSIRSFYSNCLPALGWSLSPTGDDELVFLRGRERLSISTTGEAAHLSLHVRLTIRPASMNAD